MKKLMLLLLTLTALGCGQKSREPYATAPWLDFECSFTSAPTCDASADNKVAYFGLVEEMYIDCRAHIQMLDTAQWANAFDYSTHTITNMTGGIVTGMATDWVNRWEMPVVQLPESPFRLCGFIDLNNNQQVDLNEPILQGELDPRQEFLPFSNWQTF